MKKLIKTITLEKTPALVIVRFGTLLLIASLAPVIGHQLITGIIVNATLLIAVMVLGFYPALFIAFVPVFIASLSGVLPIVMTPMIPLIIVSNIILISIFNALKFNYWIKAVSASFLKFFFLFFVTFYLVTPIIGINPAIGAIIVWPQLFTALSGSLLAYLIIGKKKCKITSK